MNTRLLLKLADLLEKLPAKRFDYSRWVGRDWAGASDLSCGTVACALGWATTMPALRRRGLRLSEWHNVILVPTAMNGLNKAQIVEEDLDDAFTVGAYAFDLTLNESTYLFAPERVGLWDEKRKERLPYSPPGNAKPKTVAKHIRRFVAWKQKQKAA